MTMKILWEKIVCHPTSNTFFTITSIRALECMHNLHRFLAIFAFVDKPNRLEKLT